MSRKYLLGATKDNELVFGEFKITTRNDYPEFTASFNTVYPFNADKIDKEDYVKDYLSNFGKDDLYDMCVFHDCSPNDLPSIMVECEDIKDWKDCSLYPEELIIDGDRWLFESVGCGQHDTRNEMVEYTNKEAYDKLHELWEKYHLREVSDDVVAEVEEIINMFDEIYEEGWIRFFIEENYY